MPKRKTARKARSQNIVRPMEVTISSFTAQAFFSFLRNRERIRLGRIANMSDDDVYTKIEGVGLLSEEETLHRFKTRRLTNVYRRNDRTTKQFTYLLAEYVDNYRQSHPEVSDADVLVYAAFTLGTWRTFGTPMFAKEIGLITRWDDGQIAAIRSVVQLYLEHGELPRVLSSAYKPSSIVLESLSRKQPCWKNFDHTMSRRLADLWEVLGSVPRIAMETNCWEAVAKHIGTARYFGEGTSKNRVPSFHAKEIVQDLLDTRIFGGRDNVLDLNTWCAVGPGAKRGLNWLSGRLYPPSYIANISQKQAVFELKTLFSGGVDRFYFKWHGMDTLVGGKPPPPLELHDIQFGLCEFDKFMRMRNTRPYVRGEGDRTSVRFLKYNDATLTESWLYDLNSFHKMREDTAEKRQKLFNDEVAYNIKFCEELKMTRKRLKMNSAVATDSNASCNISPEQSTAEGSDHKRLRPVSKPVSSRTSKMGARVAPKKHRFGIVPAVREVQCALSANSMPVLDVRKSAVSSLEVGPVLDSTLQTSACGSTQASEVTGVSTKTCVWKRKREKDTNWNATQDQEHTSSWVKKDNSDAEKWKSQHTDRDWKQGFYMSKDGWKQSEPWTRGMDGQAKNSWNNGCGWKNDDAGWKYEKDNGEKDSYDWNNGGTAWKNDVEKNWQSKEWTTSWNNDKWNNHWKNGCSRSEGEYRKPASNEWKNEWHQIVGEDRLKDADCQPVKDTWPSAPPTLTLTWLSSNPKWETGNVVGWRSNDEQDLARTRTCAIPPTVTKVESDEDILQIRGLVYYRRANSLFTLRDHDVLGKKTWWSFDHEFVLTREHHGFFTLLAAKEIPLVEKQKNMKYFALMYWDATHGYVERFIPKHGAPGFEVTGIVNAEKRDFVGSYVHFPEFCMRGRESNSLLIAPWWNLNGKTFVYFQRKGVLALSAKSDLAQIWYVEDAGKFAQDLDSVWMEPVRRGDGLDWIKSTISVRPTSGICSARESAPRIVFDGLEELFKAKSDPKILLPPVQLPRGLTRLTAPSLETPTIWEIGQRQPLQLEPQDANMRRTICGPVSCVPKTPRAMRSPKREIYPNPNTVPRTENVLAERITCLQLGPQAPHQLPLHLGPRPPDQFASHAQKSHQLPESIAHQRHTNGRVSPRVHLSKLAIQAADRKRSRSIRRSALGDRSSPNPNPNTNPSRPLTPGNSRNCSHERNRSRTPMNHSHARNRSKKARKHSHGRNHSKKARKHSHARNRSKKARKHSHARNRSKKARKRSHGHSHYPSKRTSHR